MAGVLRKDVLSATGSLYTCAGLEARWRHRVNCLYHIQHSRTGSILSVWRLKGAAAICLVLPLSTQHWNIRKTLNSLDCATAFESIKPFNCAHLPKHSSQTHIITLPQKYLYAIICILRKYPPLRKYKGTQMISFVAITIELQIKMNSIKLLIQQSPNNVGAQMLVQLLGDAAFLRFPLSSQIA